MTKHPIAATLLALAALAALGLSVALPVRAAPADPFVTMFDAWAAKNKPDHAIMVVRRGNNVVSSRSRNVGPEGLTLIGSMSKAITGVCIGTLVRDGKLSFTTPMREALAGFFKRYGRPLDPRFEAVTVEELLVHRSGLLGNPDGDPIHDIWKDVSNKGRGHIAAPQPLLAQHLKQHKLARDPGGASVYSNTGYVVLTAIIEERTGKPYETYCKEAVLSKLGIKTAQLHPDWRTFSGAGGWLIAGTDYLTMLDVFDPRHPFLGDRVKAWIDQAQTRWDPNNKGGWYSLGVNTSASVGRWQVGHGGMLNSLGKDPAGRRTAAIVGSNAYRRSDGTAVFVALSPVVGGTPELAQLGPEVERLLRTTPAPVGMLPLNLILLLN